MDEADGMGLVQCPAQLLQEMNRSSWRQRTVALDYLFQRQPGQVFHDIIEGSVLGAAVVEDLDGVRVRQGRRRLHLALEPLEILRVAGPVRTDELDGARAAQQQVVGEV